MKTHADAAYDNRLQFKHNFEVWAHLQEFPDTFTTKATSKEFCDVTVKIRNMLSINE